MTRGIRVALGREEGRISLQLNNLPNTRLPDFRI
jgi:hypothetical protein